LDNIFHVYLMSVLKKYAKKKNFTVAFFKSTLSILRWTWSSRINLKIFLFKVDGVCPGMGLFQPQWNPYPTLTPPSCWVRHVRSIGDPQYGLGSMLCGISMRPQQQNLTWDTIRRLGWVPNDGNPSHTHTQWDRFTVWNQGLDRVTVSARHTRWHPRLVPRVLSVTPSILFTDNSSTKLT
jgi:hypothetical protein